MKKKPSAPKRLHMKAGILVFVLGIFSIGILSMLPQLIKIAEKQILITSASSGEDVPKVLGDAFDKKLVTKIVNKNLPAPVFSAAAVLAMDFDSGKIIFEKNTEARLAPASTTKIMTGLVGTESFKPGELLTVYPEDLVGGSSMGLQAGEKLSFRSLLYGMLLNSGNDAAFTIASNLDGGLNVFVEKMNKKAKALGLRNTHFDNPAGFDSPNHYSSAYDLAVIAKSAVQNYQLSRVVATKETSVSAWGDATQMHPLKNLNRLLDLDGVIGIKTGFTERAGESFVGLIDRFGRKVITVVLRSDDRFRETKALMEWVYENYEWQESYE